MVFIAIVRSASCSSFFPLCFCDSFTSLEQEPTVFRDCKSGVIKPPGPGTGFPEAFLGASAAAADSAHTRTGCKLSSFSPKLQPASHRPVALKAIAEYQSSTAGSWKAIISLYKSQTVICRSSPPVAKKHEFGAQVKQRTPAGQGSSDTFWTAASPTIITARLHRSPAAANSLPEGENEITRITPLDKMAPICLFADCLLDTCHTAPRTPLVSFLLAGAASSDKLSGSQPPTPASIFSSGEKARLQTVSPVSSTSLAITLKSGSLHKLAESVPLLTATRPEDAAKALILP
mmetsp:Transcript_10591/g.24111  ORF Transcript_10591/g.24111 Transcript_10591/m.24111 type:complete len:290 (-) Transcript_10591:1787-2656(-)